MKSNPKFSIITVCYNAAKDLEKTINSVNSQSFKDYEYIVIDGESVDSTVDILKKYSADIDKWVSEKDDGIYNAMNKGAKFAKGEYLFFLNAGDIFYDNGTLEEISSLVSNTRYSMVYGNIAVVDSEGKIVRVKKTRLSRLNVKLGTKVGQQGVFFSREVFESVGGINETYKIAGDFDLLCKILERYEDIFYTNSSVSRYDNSGVSSNLARSYGDTSRVIKDRYGNLFLVIYYLKTRLALIYTYLFGF